MEPLLRAEESTEVKKMLVPGTALLILILAAGCRSTDPANTQPIMFTETPDAPWSATYHDGSGNRFYYRQLSKGEEAHFAYTPVTPETSSSGTYSGGEAREGPVDEEHVAELWQWLVKLAADTALHAGSRMMGTGSFTVTTPSGTHRFIVKNSLPLREFNAFLSRSLDE